MQIPQAWTSEAADTTRDEAKRVASPASFFCSQGRSLVLASQYFVNDRLAEDARGGVASKHRHRINLAIFGQLMAAFEYLCKDFVAQAIDAVSIFDEVICKQDWITVDAKRILLFRSSALTAGAMLIHPTQGWHSPSQVNSRYDTIFKRSPIANAEVKQLEQLWVLRHSVAHNAGFVTEYDGRRSGMPSLSGRVVSITDSFIEEQYEFLKVVANRFATVVGDAVLLKWLGMRVQEGYDWDRDSATFAKLRMLATCEQSRTRSLVEVTRTDYDRDWVRAGGTI